MLVFMTYNVCRQFSLPCVRLANHALTTQAYLIAATVIGAALGHFIFSPSMDIEAVLSGGVDSKGMACH